MPLAPTADDRERMFVDPGPRTYKQVRRLGEELAWELCLTVKEEMEEGEQVANPDLVEQEEADGWLRDEQAH